MTTSDTNTELRERAHELMPWAVDHLAALVRIPSVATEGFPVEPLLDAHDHVVRLLQDAGVTDIADLKIEGKKAPVVVATVPGPAGAPTVLFYTHYDVVPAGDESLWDTPPFEPVVRDGAMYGRGTADSKANIVGIAGVVRMFDAAPPVTMRIVIEGQEEFGSPFDFYPASDPETFASVAMVIADLGSVRPGFPTLTTALRGSATVTVELQTLAHDKHSGQFGGAAPDARLAVMHALATLHDANGDVAVPGLMREEWNGAEYEEDEFRELAEVRDGIPLQGTGGIGSRIWSGPAITVIGFDAPSSTAPMNAVASSARAVLNLRISPMQSAVEAQQALVDHLRAQRPFGLELTVAPGEIGDGVAVDTSGSAASLALNALSEAWERSAVAMASGGSIPIVVSLHQAVPTAQQLLFGATDGHAGIHGPNERVLLDELERSMLAKAIFLRDFARTDEGMNG